MPSKKQSFKKIVVTSSKLMFAVGARLGLDSKWATAHRAYLKAVDDAEGEFDVTTRVAFPRGVALWAECKDDKVLNCEGSYEISDMPRGYREEDPEDAAKRAAVLAPAKKQPAKKG